MFASQITKEIAIPGGFTAVIRKLSRRHLNDATLAQQAQALADLKTLGGMSVLKEIAAETKASDSDKEDNSDDAPANPLLMFDVPTLCRKGIVSWTRPEDLAGVDWDDVDDEADAVAVEILKLSRPVLFQSKSDAEAEQKNG